MPAFNVVHAEFYMPCGHCVGATWEKTLTARNQEELDPATYVDQLERAGNSLNEKLTSLAARHECDLVTDENPFGLRRKN